MFDFINRINSKLSEDYTPIITAGKDNFYISEVLPNEYEEQQYASFLIVKTTSDVEVDISIASISAIRYLTSKHISDMHTADAMKNINNPK
ncbi:hypothetical protein NGH46_06635 [Staphylococcus xylosus]|uniref:hypothetical protein n=1 Tax=Staphylococcus xylosus TaxID=1288 RepID=UPI002DB65824|nr:hypothetical protein [Staphylococcus xylosus]MEB8121793.1 hypothetical protein [Staphylococcus xylosus]